MERWSYGEADFTNPETKTFRGTVRSWVHVISLTLHKSDLSMFGNIPIGQTAHESEKKNIYKIIIPMVRRLIVQPFVDYLPSKI